MLFLPGSVLTLAGGALFGPAWGTLYNLVGATLGATLAFLVARYLASHWVQARIESGAGGRVDRLVKGVEAEGWRFVAFTRMVPLLRQVNRVRDRTVSFRHGDKDGSATVTGSADCRGQGTLFHGGSS